MFRTVLRSVLKPVLKTLVKSMLKSQPKTHLNLKSCLAALGLSSLCVCLSGCERKPSVDIFGSYFPVWFFCVLGGFALMLITRYIFIRTRLDQEIGPLALIYPCLTVLFSFILWYVFFP